jgi:PAS domain-containing protein
MELFSGNTKFQFSGMDNVNRTRQPQSRAPGAAGAPPLDSALMRMVEAASQPPQQTGNSHLNLPPVAHLNNGTQQTAILQQLYSLPGNTHVPPGMPPGFFSGAPVGYGMQQPFQMMNTSTITSSSPPEPFTFDMPLPVAPVQHIPEKHLPEKRKAASGSRSSKKAPRTSKKAPRIEPSVVSSSSSATFAGESLAPPKEKTSEELAKLTPVQRRRYERNLREQQRSYRISQQIKQLRDVLDESNIPFKPNKFSILVSVAEYIKQLQARAIMLDAEHEKLMKTIELSSQAVSSGQAQSCSSDDSKDAASDDSDEGNELVLVHGINYCEAFQQSPFAMGVASLDGRILSCNDALAQLFGCDESEMIKQSLFFYIRNHQDVFEAMAGLLKRSSETETRDDVVGEKEDQDEILYWCGHVINHDAQKVRLVSSLMSLLLSIHLLMLTLSFFSSF